MNEQLKSAIYGLAVADALGVPGEFQRRGGYRIDDMVGGGAHNQPAGTFSDDASMALACANMGDDTDTVAAVAGTLAGIVYGFDAIPRTCIDALRGREIIDACLW